MLPKATKEFMEKACRGSIAPPVVVFDDGESGMHDDVLHLKTVDGWNVVAEGLVSYLFHKVRALEVDPASPDLARAELTTPVPDDLATDTQTLADCRDGCLFGLGGRLSIVNKERGDCGALGSRPGK